MMRRLLIASFLLLAASLAREASAIRSPEGDWRADWIGVVGGSKPNTWICFRKQINLEKAPASAVARISCDSKYWLWINGEQVVFEGQLKRGPTPRDTYFDRVDLAPHLRVGENTIAVMVCHFGRHGFSHNSSGRAAMLFDAVVDSEPLLSDETWQARVHPAFGTTDPPLDNVRQPESNLRFDARHDIGPWMASDYDDSSWGPPTLFGKPPIAPWNGLYERPIPPWSDTGLIDYAERPEFPLEGNGENVVCRLPYNAHVTPYLKVDAEAGKVIGLHTDAYEAYGKLKLVEIHRHEYVTRDGVQEFELPAWINGHEVVYTVPKGVRVLDLKYRETAYDTEVVGDFQCNDERLNQLWQESLRTLRVTMRDTYMDCPDRERAQWWGDAVNELGEAFYAFEYDRAPLLAKKGVYELARWQREDKTLYSPVPSGIRRDGLLYPLDGSWNQELPRQMLASVGWYGFWTYYWYTGDKQTIVDAYPAVKRYLDLWEIGDDGLVVHRAGGWDWTDWGEHRDVPVIENAWVYLALKAAIEMARLADAPEDVSGYQRKMGSIAAHFDATFWRGDKYRSIGHEGETDDRANAMAVIAGLAPTERYEAVAEVLRRERHASPYMEKYVLEAMMLLDRPDDALQRMRERYAGMLDDDKSTLWEFFDPIELPGFGSLGRGTFNHAWSGGPLTVLSQYVAGVAPAAPAYSEYQVRPNIGSLEWIRSTTPTPHGPIGVDVRQSSEGYLITINAPEAAIGTVSLPIEDVSRCLASANGAVVWDQERATDAGGVKFVGRSEGHLNYRISPGRTEFIVTQTAQAEDNPNELTDEERGLGFQRLFDGESLDLWTHDGNWRVDNGAIFRADGGGFVSRHDVTIPDDFELRFQWKVAEGANSGVYYRPGQYEYQILDNRVHSDGNNPRTSAASLYFCVAPARDATRPAGEWNDGRIVCKGTVIQHWLNGEAVVDFDYTNPKRADDVARLAELGGDLASRGGVLHLQDHGDPVWFRAIRLREIPSEEEVVSGDIAPALVPPEAIAKEQAILESRRAALRAN